MLEDDMFKLEDDMFKLEDEVLELADEDLTNEEAALELSELETSTPEAGLEKVWLFPPPPPPQADNIRITHINLMFTRQVRFKYNIKTPRMRTPQNV